MPESIPLDHLSAWITLRRNRKLRPAQRFALVRTAGGPQRVLAQLPGNTTDASAESEAHAVARWIGSAPEHHLVTAVDPDYPPLLAQIPDPPLYLFVNGRRDVLGAPQVAIVGSRNPSPQGREDAAAFASALAEAGMTVTSGLAVGIDGAAHRGALRSGTTLAVTGCGPDRIYPYIHKGLAAEIVATGGALVSEFLPGTPPRPANFPQRNRLISGLAAGTFVVEAALQSGSLITARMAAEQGREVFARPGSIHAPLARGCHALIREGAKLVEQPGDILEELPFLLSVPPPAGTSERKAEAQVEPRGRSAEENRLLACIDHDPATVDVLVQRSGLTAERVSSMLLCMELDGLIHACPGGGFVRRTAAEGSRT